ncbi:MAG: Hpt domain-containing protein [Clostridia bacterium]|nr:Hpt domain-containing protein [Clostridia bacterium]
MTLKDLYTAIEGDYDKAMGVLRIEKLMDKHIRKFPDNAIFAELSDAGNSMDKTRIFESAHAIKGVCSNLGLVKIADCSSEICEEFREGNERKLTDSQVREKIALIEDLFKKASAGIKAYEQANQ